MSGIAEITIVGNVGRDPEVRFTAGGKSVTSFSVAVSTGKKNADGSWTDETDWFRVAAFGDMGERVSEQLRRGSRVLVLGRFKARTWTDKDGAAKTSLEVAASKVVPLDKREAGAPAAPEGEDDLSSLKW